MSQVQRTTNDIIVNALYLIGELGVGETPDAFMLTSGLEIVNGIIDQFSMDSIYIPYLTTINFNLVPGQATYSFSDLVPADVIADRIVDLTFANYFVAEIEYPLRIITKAVYYNLSRQTNLMTRPGYVFLNRQPTESFITFYPAPDQAYPCKIQVKSMIDKLEPQENINELPPFYYRLLKFAVAREFMAYYPSGNWPSTSEETYQDMYNSLKNANETDVTIRPSSIFQTNDPFYWQMILAYY